jgi:penicillin-binding protein 1A
MFDPTSPPGSTAPKSGSPWDRFLKPVAVTRPAEDEREAAVLASPAALAPPSNPTKRWVWLRRGGVAGLLLLILIIAWLAVTAPLSKSLEPIAPPRLTLVSADGQPFAQNGAIVDRPVKIATLPPHVAQAFIAIEDRRFYSHFGVDPRGLARAAWNNLGSGGTQGGSTITQQLAKFTFLTADRTLSRKAREMLIAFWLEAWLTKDQILERYLSNAYFGDNLYGLRAASRHYFYRQPEKLTLAQAATLAGLVQAPSRLAPTRNPKAAAKRARLVLAAMADQGYVTAATAKATGAAATDVRLTGSLPTGTYFADWAMPEARRSIDTGYGEQRVVTTLNARLQRAARDVVARAPLGKAQVALIAMRPNGEIVAMVGGRSYKASAFNRATQGQRQSGSTFKLFVYLAALRSGMTPDSRIEDTPITEGPYRPKNSSGHYRGTISLREAFAQSSNVAAVRLYQKLGHAAVLKAARDLGVKSAIANDPSVALGSSGMSLLELTSAFASVAADQYPVKPHAVTAEAPGFLGKMMAPERNFDGSTHAMLLDLLGAVVNQGTGRAAQLPIKAYGKTGTSQEGRDALFVGFAGDLVVGVWVGNDDNKPLSGVNGGGLPARIWRDFMGRAVKGAAPVRAQPKPDPNPDPQGPVEPLDLPELPKMPDFNNTEINVENGDTLRVKTDLGGVPIDLRLGKDGFRIDPGTKGDKR